MRLRNQLRELVLGILHYCLLVLLLLINHNFSEVVALLEGIVSVILVWEFEIDLKELLEEVDIFFLELLRRDLLDLFY